MKVDIEKLIADKEYCRKVFNFFIKNQTIKKTILNEWSAGKLFLSNKKEENINSKFIYINY
ncbi:MAG: hypothetical protein QT10_C0017G0018 [archaeon GW2011_AR19]|nr:MAG: hypothetical protein QT10_C0017G0018 [archaeon GW2011_AR19]